MRRWAIGITSRGIRVPSRAPSRSNSRSSGDKNKGSRASATSEASWPAATAGSSGRITRSTNRMAKAVACGSVTTPDSRRAAALSCLNFGDPAASSHATTRATASSASNSAPWVSRSTLRLPLPAVRHSL